MKRIVLSMIALLVMFPFASAQLPGQGTIVQVWVVGVTTCPGYSPGGDDGLEISHGHATGGFYLLEDPMRTILYCGYIHDSCLDTNTRLEGFWGGEGLRPGMPPVGFPQYAAVFAMTCPAGTSCLNGGCY